MRIAIALLAALVLTGCNSQPQPVVVEVRTQRLNPEYLKAQQEIEKTILKLIQSLNKDSEVRSIDFESLGLKPYTK